MDAVTGELEAGAHGGVLLEGEAQAIAVALHGLAEAVPGHHGDLTVEVAALDGIHRHQLGIAGQGRTDLAGVQAVVRVEA